MSLFAKAKTPDNSGREALRHHLWALSRKINLGNTARDSAVPLPLLDDFANSRGELNPEQLDRLARHLLDARYDAEIDRMHMLKPNEPQPMCAPGYLDGVAYDHTKDPNSWQKREASRQAFLAQLKPKQPTPEQEAAGRWPRRPGFV